MYNEMDGAPNSAEPPLSKQKEGPTDAGAFADDPMP